MKMGLTLAIAAFMSVGVQVQAATYSYQANCRSTVVLLDGKQIESKFTLALLPDASTNISHQSGDFEFAAATKTTSTPEAAVFEMAIKGGPAEGGVGVEAETLLWNSSGSGKLMPFVLSAVLHKDGVVKAKLNCVSENQN